MTIQHLRRVAVAFVVIASAGAFATTKSSAQTTRAPGTATTPPPVRSETVAQLRARLTEIASRSAAFGFSGAILALKGDSVILDRQFGFANRDENRANTANTIFNTGSLTKQFTAAAILKLEMAGKLKTTDSISKHLPNVPADKRNITIHQLLTHTSALPETDGGDQWDTRNAALQVILALPLNGAPGAQFRYANTGYNLLAAIIETTSGTTYDQYLKEQLFKPMGMNSTGMNPEPANERNVASYYMGEVQNGTTQDFFEGRIWAIMGSGGVLTTSADMRKWINALNSDKLLNAAARRKLFTPVLNGYAYGWALPRNNAGQLIEHDGGNTLGVGAFVLWYKDADVAIIGFCNDDGETTLLGQNGVRRHIRTALEGGTAGSLPAVVAASNAQLASLTGTFRSGDNSVIITNHNGQLRLIGMGARPFAALAPLEASDSAFVAQQGSRALRGIQAAMQEDSAGATPPFIPRAAGRLVAFGQAAKEDFGAFVQADIMGARVESEGDDPTLHVRLSFANGVQYLRVNVTPRGLAGLDFMRRPPSVPAAVTGANELTFYAWGSGKVTKFRLNGNMLEFERDGVTLRLPRQ